MEAAASHLGRGDVSAPGPQHIAIIPARGGSKGIPGKNLAPLGGQPLIAWTINAAQAAATVDRTVVSTDDRDIAAVAEQHGAEVPALRPPELATDEASTDAVLQYAVDLLELDDDDVVILLQPTSPLRTAKDIDAAATLFLQTDCDVVMGTRLPRDHPDLCFLDGDGHLEALRPDGLVRRQDLRRAVAINGSIYVATARHIRGGPLLRGRMKGHLMSSAHSVDIDEPEDLSYAEWLLTQGESND